MKPEPFSKVLSPAGRPTLPNWGLVTAETAGDDQSEAALYREKNACFEVIFLSIRLKVTVLQF
jgi:hypothetical protein